MADQSNGHSTSAQHHENPSLATLGVHGDDPINSYTDVAPALHLATTFRYPSSPSLLDADVHPAKRSPEDHIPADSHVYSRLTAPNTSRLELVLSKILRAPCLTYSSGLSAIHALLVHLHPRVVAIGAGYHGCHGVLEIYQRLTGCKIVDLFDEKTWEGDDDGSWRLGQGDVVHVETPVNPTGEAYDIAHFASRAHARGAVLTVDATFAPPPLQDPFLHGADYVMHSGTKYFGGHSDMLCGVVGINKGMDDWEKSYWGLSNDRVFLGAVMGSLEGWLGVRSLRTLELRVRRQSENCMKLVEWIHSCLDTNSSTSPEAESVRNAVAKISHSSLQLQNPKDKAWLSKQMPSGHGPVFAIWTHNATQAKTLPSKLDLFHHATSLGGVESLIEWRRMSDKGVEETLLRVSVGVEGWEDLREDLLRAFTAVAGLA